MATQMASSTDDRFDYEADWMARQFFADYYLTISPEEYAARHAYNWACFAYHRYRYRDPVLGAWVRRFGEILFTEGELERCRQRFLTPEELAEIRRQEAEDF
jgi:hypothetical protein